MSSTGSVGRSTVSTLRRRPDLCYNTPADLTIGQLSDSWEFLRTPLADPDDALTYHLVWLADILRAIGEDNVG
ncbi:hypothetical protein [Nocardia testacea]|uniref:hypothetical protein n=1 Tax=Nocardia testacea TaxID=248551 RepID=UPI00340DE670